jgi:transposase
MNKKRIYYPRTTYSQRKLLFATWEETQDVAFACRQAHISESTFYYWKPRYEAAGYAGLKEAKKPGPEKGMWTKAKTQAKVVAMKKANPAWGKQRIADELSKENSWVPVISANTVRRILQEHGLWEGVVEAGKKRVDPVSRTAEEPGQSLNVDLPLCQYRVIHLHPYN